MSNTRSNNAYSFTGHANVNIVDTHDGLNQLVTTAGTGVTEDARGNVTAIGGTAYAYTTDNRLRTAGTGTMTYGPEGALLSAASPSATTRFDSLLGHVIAERDGSGNRLRMFVPGPGVDEPMVWYEGNGTTTRRWLHKDERGSVIAVSDSGGNLVGSINRYHRAFVANAPSTGPDYVTDRSLMCLDAKLRTGRRIHRYCLFLDFDAERRRSAAGIQGNAVN